jgi:TIR domain
VFFDRHSLAAGSPFDDRIRQEIEESEFFIFLVSPHSVEHGAYALSELEFARRKWPDPDGAVSPSVSAGDEPRSN